MLRNITFLICSLGIAFAAVAESKKTVREPAATRVKRNKSITCSNAMGDGGYTVTIFDYKRATILENSLYGAKQAANLTCNLIPARNAPGGADMIQDFLRCSGEATDGLNKGKLVSIVVSHGGLAGLTEADLTFTNDDKVTVVQAIEDMSCK